MTAIQYSKLIGSFLLGKCAAPALKVRCDCTNSGTACVEASWLVCEESCKDTYMQYKKVIYCRAPAPIQQSLSHFLSKTQSLPLDGLLAKRIDPPYIPECNTPAERLESELERNRLDANKINIIAPPLTETGLLSPQAEDYYRYIAENAKGDNLEEGESEHSVEAAAFNWAKPEEPTEETMRGIRFNIQNVALHVDAIHSRGVVPKTRTLMSHNNLKWSPDLPQQLAALDLHFVWRSLSICRHHCHV